MPAPGFDHVGLIVPDLARSRARFEAMGFRLSARADHTMTDAQGRTVSAGSAQHTLMLPEGYVELMQITAPGSPHPLAAAPSARYGVHVLALSVSDAEDAHARFDSASRQADAHPAASVGALRRWARPIRERDREGLARFAFFDSPWTPQDPSYLCFVEHLTPELLRSPIDCLHANGARSVREIVYAGPPELVAGFAGRLSAFGLTARKVPGALILSGLRSIGALPAARDLESTAAPAPWIVTMNTTTLRLEMDPTATALRPVALEIDFSAIDALESGCRAAGIACVDWPKSTLTGPGGSDRRRLAVEVGEQCGLTLIASS